MKRMTRKRVLAFVCAMTLCTVLLVGCGNKISDPWLDKWQDVVVNRSAEIEKAEIYYYRGAWSSVAGDPEPQTTYDADRISDMLDALSAPVTSFYIATESTDTADTDNKNASKDKAHLFVRGGCIFYFYIRGEEEPFIVTFIRSGHILLQPAVVFYEIDENSALQSEEMADIEALNAIAESILNAQ